MAVPALSLRNITSNRMVTVDIRLSPNRVIRESLRPTQAIDISDVTTLDELIINPAFIEYQTRQLLRVESAEQLIGISSFDKTSAPTVDDDINAGYDVGSFWLDETVPTLYVCTDPTAGAAVWTSLTATGGPPSGAASGQLGGTYPGPDVRGLRETGGPTLLTIAGIADGEFLRRSGATIVGAAATAAASVEAGGWTTAGVATGEAAAITGDLTVSQADASSGSGTQSFGGIVTAVGTLATEGLITGIQFITGLTPSAGDRVYLSKTAGALTTDATVFTAGDLKLQVGKVADASAYVGTLASNSKMTVLVQEGEGLFIQA